MNKAGELIFLHIWFFILLAMCISTIWGNMAEKTYDTRMKWWKWLTFGAWTDKEFFIKFHKKVAYYVLPFGVIVYFLILFSIINK